MIIDQIASIILQPYAGFLVDRHNPKRIAVLSDALRGAVLIALCLLVRDISVGLIIAVAVATNVGKPFYRTSRFTLYAESIPKAQLQALNARGTVYFQAGQLTGIALAYPVLTHSGIWGALFINGLSFVISAFLVHQAPLKSLYLNSSRAGGGAGSFVSDWRSMWTDLRRQPSVFWHVLLSGNEYLIPSIVNLAIAPTVLLLYGGNLLWLSVFDGAFALGAISAGLYGHALINRYLSSSHLSLLMAAQSLIFVLLALAQSEVFTALLIFAVAFLNALSIVMYTASLQAKTAGKSSGKTSALRGMLVAILSTAVLPVISTGFSSSAPEGFVRVAVFCALVSMAGFLLTSGRLSRKALVTDDD